MPEVLTWHIDGFAEMGKRLATLDDDIQKRIAFAAVSSAARVIKKKAIENAIKNNLRKSGSLIENIAIARSRVGETGLSQYSYKIAVRGRKRAKKGGNNPWYWWLHEFGSSKIPAQPFITPALMSERSKSLEAMARILERRLQKAGV